MKDVIESLWTYLPEVIYTSWTCSMWQWFALCHYMISTCNPGFLSLRVHVISVNRWCFIRFLMSSCILKHGPPLMSVCYMFGCHSWCNWSRLPRKCWCCSIQLWHGRLQWYNVHCFLICCLCENALFHVFAWTLTKCNVYMQPVLVVIFCIILTLTLELYCYLMLSCFSVQRWPNCTAHLGKNFHSRTSWSEGKGGIKCVLGFSIICCQFSL